MWVRTWWSNLIETIKDNASRSQTQGALHSGGECKDWGPLTCLKGRPRRSPRGHHSPGLHSAVRGFMERPRLPDPVAEKERLRPVRGLRATLLPGPGSAVGHHVPQADAPGRKTCCRCMSPRGWGASLSAPRGGDLALCPMVWGDIGRAECCGGSSGKALKSLGVEITPDTLKNVSLPEERA